MFNASGGCQLLCIECMNSKVLYSTGNYIQYPVIKYNGKNMKKNICYV